MAESKHGGSPSLGLAPAGLENLKPEGEGKIIVPDIVRTRESAMARAQGFERRRVALELLPQLIAQEPNETVVDTALTLADELIAKTGGHVAGVA